MQLQISRVMPVIALYFATAAFAHVSTDYNHRVDFNRFHTYSWIGIQAGNSLWQDRIMNAVDNQLKAKGWTRVPSGGEATVSAFGKTMVQDTFQTFYDSFPGWGWGGWGGWGGFGGGTAITTVQPNRIGSLTVDIFNDGTRQLIWRGTATKTLSNKARKNIKKLDHVVQEMFEHFPPEAKG